MPLVSIVVPVYNGMPYLTELTASILGQTHRDLDIVFSDGGSSDGSLDWLRTLHDDRVRIIEFTGTGAAGNWTAATQAARGSFIKLVCQDDLLAPDAIERQLGDLERCPTAVMAIGKRDIIDAQGTVVYAPRGLAGIRASVLPGSEALRACYLRGTNVIGEPVAVLFRREPLLAAMPWNDDIPLMLDLATYERVAPMGDVAIRHESVGAFRVSASSWSTRLAKEQLEQTRTWQQGFGETMRPTPWDRLRATVGRHVQVGLRRLAYVVLRWRGGFHGESGAQRA